MSNVDEKTAALGRTQPDKVVPYAILGEMTHRFPLQCPYCSNPLMLERASEELSTEDWKRVMDEAVDMGVLHFHFSGGEPTSRKDLEELVAHAAKVGLYTNLITSAVLLSASPSFAFPTTKENHSAPATPKKANPFSE